MLVIEVVCSEDDSERDQGAQRVVHLEPDDEWEEIAEGDGEIPEIFGVEEDDHEPLPPRRRQRTTGTGGEHSEGPLPVGGTQVQRRVALSAGRRSAEIPSSEASRDSNPRGPGSWAPGGTPVQRRVNSSLGRRSRDNLCSQDSDRQEKRLRVGSGLVTEVPSSPPITPRSGSMSMSSDIQGTASEKSGSRKHLKKEFVPEGNRRVHELAKKFLQAEVLAYHPWPNTATIEGMVRRSWNNAWNADEAERKGCYPGSGRTSNEAGPTKEPDNISLGIVSVYRSLLECRSANILR